MLHTHPPMSVYSSSSSSSSASRLLARAQKLCSAAFTYPDNMISSSNPYSFMCCRPQPSFIRFGMYLRIPVRFGVWYMRISTRSGPNSEASGARSEAEQASGLSRVPRRASVRMLSLRSGFVRSAAWSVAIC